MNYQTEYEEFKENHHKISIYASGRPFRLDTCISEDGEACTHRYNAAEVHYIMVRECKDDITRLAAKGFVVEVVHGQVYLFQPVGNRRRAALKDLPEHKSFYRPDQDRPRIEDRWYIDGGRRCIRQGVNTEVYNANEIVNLWG